MRYYISDCHFYHRSLLTSMDKRPFDTVEDMNEFMIERWNSRVNKNDEVVILGDFSWGNAKQTMELLERLKGRKFLIRGNHDLYLNDKDFDPNLFGWVKDYAELRDNKRKVVLCHYPIACYNGQYRLNEQGKPKTWMLYGHIHDTHDQLLMDAYCQMVRTHTHQRIGTGEEAPIPIQMINCFTMRSNYVPLTLDEWIELEARRTSRIPAPELAGDTRTSSGSLDAPEALRKDDPSETA